MKRLNIIGCGKVGKVVGRLFHEAGRFEIGDILTRSALTAHDAAAFIGAGRPVRDYDDLQQAEIHLIAASDDAIAGCAEALAQSGVIRPDDVVWHLSGALPSSVLAPARAQGAKVASVHPVSSFADSAVSVGRFAGTWCGMEGDDDAVALLEEAFTATGGRPFQIDAAFKTLYHAGAVIACNYLTSLLELGIQCYQKAGLSTETALQVMEPLVRGTIDNIFRVGTEQALTGPISRGDASVVASQVEALEKWNHDAATIYRSLGRIALDLSLRRHGSSSAGLDSVARLLDEKEVILRMPTQD